ncbi:MAG: AcvB/VirJ family lysyl-phosphatidylglycerol hydrolase [Gemmatimonadales bacterium]
MSLLFSPTLACLVTALAVAQPSLTAGVQAQADSNPVLGLPVVEVPTGTSATSTLGVILSGDGGWAAGDKAMASTLADSGVAVVGVDVPSYLQVKRTPDGAADDMGRLLHHYLDAWHKDRVILVGYSHGADIVPFIASRLPLDLRNRIDLIALLGLEYNASFEFHLADIVADISHEGSLPVLPELEKLRGMPILCVRGADEAHSLCGSLSPSLARVETRPGGHRIPGSEGRATADLILAAARSLHR